MRKKAPFSSDVGHQRKRLGDNITQLGNTLGKLVERYPTYCLAAMLVCMLISCILAFTVMRINTPKTSFPEVPAFSSVGAADGMKQVNQIIATYGAIQEIEELQNTIGVLIAKDSLSRTDSIQLSHALKQFELLQHSLIQNDN